MRMRYVVWGLMALLGSGSIVVGMMMVRDYQTAAAAEKELGRLLQEIAGYERQVRENGELKLKSIRRHHNAVRHSNAMLFGSLRSLQVSPAGTDLSPLACKLRIIEAIQKMDVQLSEREVAVGSGVAAYGYRYVTSSGKMPDKSEVPGLLLQLELTEELVDLTARSRLASLDRFQFLGSLRQADYGAMRFQLGCTGSAESIRTLVRRLNHARYFLVVRSVALTDAGDGKVSASIEVDYLTFELLSEVLADAG